jgi:hypothetical protein
MERSVKKKKMAKETPGFSFFKKTWILIIKAFIVGLIIEIYDIVSVIHTYYVSIKRITSIRLWQKLGFVCPSMRS